jgi:hypothetical protein
MRKTGKVGDVADALTSSKEQRDDPSLGDLVTGYAVSMLGVALVDFALLAYAYPSLGLFERPKHLRRKETTLAKCTKNVFRTTCQREQSNVRNQTQHHWDDLLLRL